ncbi:tripartite tricarboxylate transporter substrate-binding protein [Variovorax sp. NFACC27]|uniref:tripartite tricarboxylate transporter substrate-binding protein n=1 Tax=unclassified Variovorax TaxID=663243 RepID=UPI0015A18818
MARLIAQKLNEQLGYTVIVDNKPGAGGNLGAEAALREPADGYTLLVISGSYAGNAVLMKPAFDPVAAIKPIVQFSHEPIVFVVGTNSSIKSLKELVEKAKRNPGAVTYGSSGVGGLAHLSTEYFASIAGIKLNHIPYKGTSGAMVDLAGGQIEFFLGGTTSVNGLVKGGKVRALAVASPKRISSMPDVPTLTEQGFSSFKGDLWHGLAAARSVPPAVVAKLNRDINTVLQMSEVKARLAADDVAPAGGTPQAFSEVIRADMERWQAVVRQADIKIN